MILEKYLKNNKSSGWKIWPANIQSEFQIANFSNTYYLLQQSTKSYMKNSEPDDSVALTDQT